MLNSSKYQNCSDSEILQNFFSTKNNEWLSVLFPRYTLLVFGVCMKYLKNEQDAKDSTQQIFEKCIAELQKYQVVYFKSWLYQITKNYCLMQLRHHPLKNPIDIDGIAYSLSAPNKTENLEELSLKELTLDTMIEALGELTVEQQQCVTLFYLEKKSYQEIGDKLGFNYLQVKSFIQNGKRNLKLIVQKKLQQNNSF